MTGINRIVHTSATWVRSSAITIIWKWQILARLIVQAINQSITSTGLPTVPVSFLIEWRSLCPRNHRHPGSTISYVWKLKHRCIITDAQVYYYSVFMAGAQANCSPFKSARGYQTYQDKNVKCGIHLLPSPNIKETPTVSPPEHELFDFMADFPQSSRGKKLIKYKAPF